MWRGIFVTVVALGCGSRVADGRLEDDGASDPGAGGASDQQTRCYGNLFQRRAADWETVAACPNADLCDPEGGCSTPADPEQ